MKKLILTFSLLPSLAFAQTQPNPVQDTVAKAIGDFYIQVVTLQTQLNQSQLKVREQEAELEKCHKDGCQIKTEPPKSK